jgi:hypothetical protein
MTTESTTAKKMARDAKINPKRFRRALRLDSACKKWHRHYGRWTVTSGTREHDDMLRVLNEISN